MLTSIILTRHSLLCCVDDRIRSCRWKNFTPNCSRPPTFLFVLLWSHSSRYECRSFSANTDCSHSIRHTSQDCRCCLL